MNHLMSKSPTGAGHAPRPMQMNLQDLQKLLEAADQLDKGDKNQRRHARYRLRSRVPISQVSLFDSGNSSRTIAVLHRNLSRSGASILHTAYVHVGTKARLHLPDNNGHATGVDGEVMRCIHVSGVVYEIGIKFDAEIDIRNFAAVDAMAGQFSLEQVDAKSLKGKLLILTGHALTGEIIRKHLADSPLVIQTVSTMAEARGLITQRYGTILIDTDIGLQTNESPTKLISELCASGSPIVAVSADTSTQLAAQVRAAGAAAMLQLPVERGQLLRALGETMIVGLSEESGGTVLSKHAKDSEWQPLIKECVEELHVFAKDGLAMLDKGQYAELKVGAARIAGTAGSVGFASINATAKRLLERVEHGAGIEELRKLYGNLLSLCNRARVD